MNHYMLLRNRKLTDEEMNILRVVFLEFRGVKVTPYEKVVKRKNGEEVTVLKRKPKKVIYEDNYNDYIMLSKDIGREVVIDYENLPTYSLLIIRDLDNPHIVNLDAIGFDHMRYDEGLWYLIRPQKIYEQLNLSTEIVGFDFYYTDEDGVEHVDYSNVGRGIQIAVDAILHEWRWLKFFTKDFIENPNKDYVEEIFTKIIRNTCRKFRDLNEDELMMDIIEPPANYEGKKKYWLE